MYIKTKIMKTVKTTILVCMFLALGLAKSVAGENEVYKRAFYELEAQINEVFAQFPFEAISSYNNEVLMIVTFTVNKNHQLENISVESEDKELSQYVLSRLERTQIKVNPALDGKYCRMPVRFVNATK
jgi:hypothetical protein